MSLKFPAFHNHKNKMKQKTKLKSIRARVFKFEEGEIWDGDERIIEYIENILVDDESRIKQKTSIRIQVVKAIKKGGLNSSFRHQK